MAKALPLGFHPVMALALLLASENGNAFTAPAAKPAELTASQSEILGFVESLAYLLFIPKKSDVQMPASGPNLYGCSISDLGDFDYCKDVPSSFKDKAIRCPVHVVAGFGQNSCDLDPEDGYSFVDNEPKRLAFKVRGLGGAERVAFTFAFVVSSERIPDLANLPYAGVPWEIGRVAAAAELSQGAFFDEQGNSVAKFHLSYHVEAGDSKKVSGLYVCNPSASCRGGTHGGKVEIVFSDGAKVAQDYSLAPVK